MSELAEGSALANKYRVGRQLGTGGMATVYEGEHMRLGQKVAIKVLHEDLAEDPQLIARFEREGRALSKLKSRHVVRVFDVDETPSGRPFLVMERLDGSDLDQEIAARGPLPIAEAVAYVSQACSAMAEAHAVGVVHRDLKPSNLFLTTDGATRIVKVLDFGIAMDAVPEHSPRLTHTEAVMGTPVYMAPEQFRRTRDVDGRADIWALGATLYELLTGKPPFTGTAATIALAVVLEDYPPVANARPEVPPELSAVIARTLQKDPANRYATMTELADALLPFGDSVVVVPRTSSPDLPAARDFARASTHPAMLLGPSQTHAGPSASAQTPANAAPLPLAPRRRSLLPWVALGLATMGGIGALLLTMSSRHVPATQAGLVATATIASAAPSPSVASSVPVVAAPAAPSASQGSIAPGVAASAAPRGPKAPAASSTPSAPAASGAHASPPADKTVPKPAHSNAPPLFFPGQ